MDQEIRERIVYAFGHLVASFNPEDPHHADSGDLAIDTLNDIMEITEEEIDLLAVIAEEVAGNYRYTGEANEIVRRIKAGEI